MDSTSRPPRVWPIAQLLIALGLLPLLLSWGLGTVHPWLDAAARFSVWIALAPAASGGLGLAAVTFVAVLAMLGDRAWPAGARHLDGVSESLGLLAAGSLLCAASAMTRPLLWVAVAAAVLAPAVVSQRPPGSRSPLVALRHLGGALCWFLAARTAPFGEGLLGAAQEDALAAWLVTVPQGAGQALLLLLIAGIAALLWRSHKPSWRWALCGAAAALGFEHGFGNLAGAALSAAAIGALSAAWPAPLEPRRCALPAVLWLLVLALLCGLRLGVAERWDCRTLERDGAARLLQPGPGFTGIALVPDNMPFLVLLGDGGRTLTRLSPGGGGVSESRALEPAGGVLVSPPPGTKVVGRLIQSEAGVLRVEWWDVFTLQRTAAKEVPVHCDPGLSFIEPGGARQWISCQGSHEVLVVDSRPDGPLTRWQMGSPVLGVQRLVGGVLIDRAGRDARAGIYDAQGRGLAELALGPFSSGLVSVSEYGEAFAVARGPTGHLELRGRAPTVEYQTPLDLDTEEGALEALGSRWDSVRVGHWPGRPLWIEGESSAYVPSPFDARIWRVDLEVSWHQSSVAVGAPPIQVVVDSPSQTLYGVNRCGVFEARLRSTFPWRNLPPPPVPSIPPVPPAPAVGP
jgi:hypothetical protein